jgi:hypothetical protein
MMKSSKLLYAKVYLFWFIWISVRSFLAALALALFTALMVYIFKGFATLNMETFLALREIVYLSFPITFSLSLIIALLLVFKALFAHTIGDVSFVLYDCKHEKVDDILLSDVTMLWRKWLFITVWMILLFLVLLLGVSKLIFGVFPPLAWFNGYSLYLLIMLFGGGVFVFVVNRCKKIGIHNV